MQKAKPPCKPRGENKSTTIGIQEKQIKQLIDRVQELAEQRDGNVREVNSLGERVRALQSELHIAEGMLDRKNEHILDLKHTNLRMLGYQDCARDIFDRMFK